MATADYVMLKDKDGKGVTVHVTSDTKVIKATQPATVADIQNGMRVAITAVTENVNTTERMRATPIELGAVATAK